VRDKVVSAAEAVAIIRSGDMITTSGFVGVGTPDEIYGALEGSVRARASPDSSSLGGAAPGGYAASRMPSTVTVRRRRSSRRLSAETCWCG
jgi:propionate CoA-transferase